MNDLITIVVPVYNVEEYLERCVDSIINQTYQNLEIILVDDGSSDNSGKICEEYAQKDNRIRVIHKENGGLSDARNAGIDVATGNFISFVDSDDYIENTFLQVLYEGLQKYHTKISISDFCIRYDTGEIITDSTEETYVITQKELLRQMLIGKRDIENSACNKLYDIKLFETIRYPVGRLYEDTATTYKLLALCDAITVNSYPLYNYMKRRDSITQCAFNKDKLQLLPAVEELTQYVKTTYPDLEEECDRKVLWSYLSTLSQLAAAKDADKTIAAELLEYVNANRKRLMKNRCLSRRDKAGLVCTKFGFGFYKIIWRLYLKINKRY